MTKYYYNGVLLPEIPADVLASFPYCWINSGGDGLIVAAYPWYYASGKLNISTSAENRKYVLSSDGMEWSLSNTYTDTGGYTVDAPITWSNHDIPNGSATAIDIYLYGSEPVPESEMVFHTIDFSETGWATKRPDVFAVSDGTTPFFVDSTLSYDSNPTLRSGAISHSGTSETTITFTLVKSGAIELNYTVSSENNYDWLYVYVDDMEVVKKSGTVSWTAYKKALSVGEHTIKFKYTKDGSQSSGSDAGAIGYVKLIGVAQDYDRKYLIRSNSTLYTVADGTLTALTETEVTASLFQTYGVDELPDGALLLGLTDPELLYWHDSADELPTLTTAVTGVPSTPQVVVTDVQDMSDPSILGIESVTVITSEDVLFVMSFDDGATWKAYDGTQWLTVDTENAGMTKATMENISLEAWAEVVTSTAYRLRFVLMDTTSYVTYVVINYLN